jgi:hypothetical protein
MLTTPNITKNTAPNTTVCVMVPFTSSIKLNSRFLVMYPLTKRTIDTVVNSDKIKICVLITVIINYYKLNITSAHQEAKHLPGKVTRRY